MAYNFATAGYHSFFRPCGGFDSEGLRSAVLQKLADFDASSWHREPICTLLNGQRLGSAEDVLVETVDAFGAVNGRQLLSPPSTVDLVLQHMRNFQAGTDLREPMRKIEDLLFSGELAAELVAGQALDFHKQDGITEVEESRQAMLVERCCSDALLAEERSGRLAIGREAAFVGCVSNFSNFLDLCRKILRNVELGVPVVVLSRSNTAQHIFRYVLRLTGLMAKHGLNQGLCTYVSCSVEEQRRLLAACPASPMYFTGSRDVAGRIREVAPRLVSSTGGPNTMLVGRGHFSEAVAAAARTSSLIEHRGQCTAMRHLVIPGGGEAELRTAFAPARRAGSVAECLRAKECAALLRGLKAPLAPGYSELEGVAVRMGARPPTDVQEKWREAYLDVTVPADGAFLEELAAWLNREQPISLALNCKADEAQELFEKTALVVYTVGSMAVPALTAQARPQEGECFGEVPPRREMGLFTAFPVLVPTSTPSYFASYTEAYLREQAARELPPGPLAGLLQLCSSPEEQGYCRLLLDYLADATTGPHRGTGARTCLYGLQRPPLHMKCCLRLGSDAGLAEAVRYILPFAATTAQGQLLVSAEPAARLQGEVLAKAGVRLLREATGVFAAAQAGYWSVTKLPPSGDAVASTTQYPLAAHFVSKLLPMGHIKSTLPDDEVFLQRFRASQKWLRMASAAPARL